NVASGQRAYFTIPGDPDTPIDATLLHVEPATEAFQSSTDTTASTSSSSAVYYNGVLSVPNEDGLLRISMTAQVTIVTAETLNALVVPASAVSTGPRGESMVQVYDAVSGSITPRRVSTGLDNKVLIEITDGVSEGELVVTKGSFAGTGMASGANGNSGSRGAFGGAGGGFLAGGGGPPPGG
ncbi:MAG: efflux transporter periplasmic adaptor subunit, partial [Alphaproteobacteria bacterium]|nr:efflux transporter periplasmic adaptor subunit [Alphaproteobacteria bacterium]